MYTEHQLIRLKYRGFWKFLTQDYDCTRILLCRSCLEALGLENNMEELFLEKSL